MAMAGQPLYITAPRIWGVRLTGELPPWVSAKDVILEMLRRHGVNGGAGRIIEYHGPGLASLTAMDRQLADFAFGQIDAGYPQRARQAGAHAIVGGDTYGQGSSREHAAIVPRYLGLRPVIAKSYARIHWQNLVNSGLLPLRFADASDYDRIKPGDRLAADDLRNTLSNGAEITIRNTSTGDSCQARYDLSARQRQIVLAGGQIPLLGGATKNQGRD